jgi:hypothetical protein
LRRRRAAGVEARTLRRWLKLPEFQTAYRQARREAFRQAIARLQQGTLSGRYDSVEGDDRTGHASIGSSAGRGFSVESREQGNRQEAIGCCKARSAGSLHWSGLLNYPSLRARLLAQVQERGRLTGVSFDEAADSFARFLSRDNLNRIIDELLCDEFDGDIEAANEWKRKEVERQGDPGSGADG